MDNSFLIGLDNGQKQFGNHKSSTYNFMLIGQVKLHRLSFEYSDSRLIHDPNDSEIAACNSSFPISAIISSFSDRNTKKHDPKKTTINPTENALLTNSRCNLQHVNGITYGLLLTK